MKTLLTPTGELTRDTDAIIRHFARRFARSCHLDPEELFNEAVVCLLERTGEVRPGPGRAGDLVILGLPTSADTLVAKNRLVRGYRLVRGQRQRGEPLPTHLAAATPTPADEAERAELIERLRAAVASLPDLERQLVVRRYGLDGGEPAMLRGLLPGRTGERARQRLAEAVDRLTVKLAVSCR